MHVCMCVYTCVYMHTRVPLPTDTHTYLSIIRKRNHAHTYTNAHADIVQCMREYSLCVYVYVYARQLCIHTYIRTYVHTLYRPGAFGEAVDTADSQFTALQTRTHMYIYTHTNTQTHIHTSVLLANSIIRFIHTHTNTQTHTAIHTYLSIIRKLNHAFLQAAYPLKILGMGQINGQNMRASVSEYICARMYVCMCV
jgi:hypothetical protein